MNFGTTWTTTTAPSTTRGILSSATGDKLLCYAGNLIFTSLDYGATWTNLNIPNYLSTSNIASIASDASGTKLVVASQGGPSGNNIYTSPDFGVSWVQTNAPTRLWSAIASNSLGDRLFAVCIPYQSIDGGIYISYDYGSHWTLVPGTTSINWNSVASDSAGVHRAAVGEGTVYTF
jgi:hypothetical protein